MMKAEDILNIFEDLKEDEFKNFKWRLKQSDIIEGYEGIKESKLENAERRDTVDEMVKKYQLQGALKMTRKVLEKIDRNDLVQRLSDTSSGPQVDGIQQPQRGLNLPAGPQQTVDPLRVQRHDLMKYVCKLELDTNTVNRDLKLSDNNRKVTHVREKQSYPDHPERFDDCPQLLCRKSLTDRCYWEVERRGDVEISVSYRGIRRRGDITHCGFGWNDQSWSLICSDDAYAVWHNQSVTDLNSYPVSNRVAVYVDCPAGTLSFYTVSSDSLIHIYTFNTTFTQPLYPGFVVCYGSSVSLCPL